MRSMIMMPKFPEPKMKQMKEIPRFPCSRQDPSCSSPTSVLPENPNLKNKKRSLPLPLCVDQRQVEMKKKKRSLSPESLHRGKLRVQFAHTIFKAKKERLEKTGMDPVSVKKQLEIFKRGQDEEKGRVEAQLAAEKRLADLEAKKKQEQIDKQRLEAKKKREAIEQERQRLEEIRRQRQKRRERRARDQMEAVAARRDKPFCCTLREIGIVSRCDHAGSWSYWGGQCRCPLEQLGLFIKEDGRDYLHEEVELEEGEIIE